MSISSSKLFSNHMHLQIRAFSILFRRKEKIDGQSTSWASVLKSAVPFLLTAGATLMQMPAGK